MADRRDREPRRASMLVTGLLALVVTITAACQADRSADESPVTGVTEVVAKRLRFRPEAIQVAVGTEVTWRFEDSTIAHNVTGDGFASKNQTSGTWTHRFDRPGEYRYTCTVHAGMDGRVVVTS
jgi:plastocyanin